MQNINKLSRKQVLTLVYWKLFRWRKAKLFMKAVRSGRHYKACFDYVKKNL